MFVKIDIAFHKSLDICTHLCKNNASINNRRRTSDECGNRNKTVPSVAGKGRLFIDFYLFNEGNFVSIIYSAFSTSKLSPFFCEVN